MRWRFKLDIKSFLAVLGTAVVYYLGGIDITLRALFVFMVLDYFTGVMRAAVYKEIDSCVGLKGIVKKVCLLILVAVATQVDLVIGTDVARSVTILFLAANEALSILENASAIGAPVPDTLRRTLASWKAQDASKDGVDN